MRRWGVFLVAGLLLVTGSAAARATGPTGPADEDPAGPATLLALINRDRAAAGLAPMVLRDDVAAIALAHSHRMADAGTIWHNDDYFTAATRARLDATVLAENVALNASLADAHDRLMNSPGHRANILDPRMSVVGIGVVRDAAATNYITQNFLAPRSAENAVLAPASPPAPSPAPATPPAAAPTPGKAPITPRAPAPVTRPRSVPGAAVPAPAAPSPPTTVTPSELPASAPAGALEAGHDPSPPGALAAPAPVSSSSGPPIAPWAAGAMAMLAMALAQCVRAARRRPPSVRSVR